MTAALLWIALTVAVIYVFVRAGRPASLRARIEPNRAPQHLAALHAISRDAFDAFNPFREAESDRVLQEVEWFTDDAHIVLGVIALDLEDQDYFAGVLGRDARGVFRAIDVETGLAARDEARTTLLAMMQQALASGETVFRQDE